MQDVIKKRADRAAPALPQFGLTVSTGTYTCL